MLVNSPNKTEAVVCNVKGLFLQDPVILCVKLFTLDGVFFLRNWYTCISSFIEDTGF